MSDSPVGLAAQPQVLPRMLASSYDLGQHGELASLGGPLAEPQRTELLADRFAENRRWLPSSGAAQVHWTRMLASFAAAGQLGRA